MLPIKFGLNPDYSLGGESHLKNFKTAIVVAIVNVRMEWI